MKDDSGIKNSTDRAWAAKSVKPQTVKNTLGRGGGYFVPGKVPPGGFQSVWCFEEQRGDYKNSPTTKPEPQNRIISKGK